LGLAGFWAADNVSYLYTSGFLIGAEQGRSRAKDASIFAARSYFFASISGLYLNWRELLQHRNGPLKEAWCRLQEHRMNREELISAEDNEAYEEHERRRDVDRLETELEKVKRKHGVLCIALLKSCCDVLVFSNNTGIDLHLKYRGKKMDETLTCVCGVTSALTVIYNNFPTSLSNQGLRL